MALSSWEERLNKAIQILSGATPYKPEEIASAATSFYGKLTAADKYKPTGKFNGTVTLVKAIDNYVQMGEDYGLSEVSNSFAFCYCALLSILSEDICKCLIVKIFKNFGLHLF